MGSEFVRQTEDAINSVHGMDLVSHFPKSSKAIFTCCYHLPINGMDLVSHFHSITTVFIGAERLTQTMRMNFNSNGTSFPNKNWVEVGRGFKTH